MPQYQHKGTDTGASNNKSSQMIYLQELTKMKNDFIMDKYVTTNYNFSQRGYSLSYTNNL